jgi:uncharacterized protein YkwD
LPNVRPETRGRGSWGFEPVPRKRVEMLHAKAPRLLVLCVTLAALLALPAASHAAGKKRTAPCANTGVAPTAGNVATVRLAVLCLHNRDRTARGLAPLRQHGKLRRAATLHSADMVAGGYFSHETPDGTDMVERILAAGFARGSGWLLGENIAWGSGELATAAQIHRSWMSSPGHRANILRREFRSIGIGIALGAPVDTDGLRGATYTADFGARR